jgi:2-keto-4-pentenoate hydratase/2-oxohepta-3-ene-1,7-dioic acid hydratase in catechol pathway
MRFVTFQPGPGHAHVGIVREDKIIDLTGWVARTGNPSHATHSMLTLIAQGDAGGLLAREMLTRGERQFKAVDALHPLEGAKLLAPIPRPTKNVFCLGRNYAEHAAEAERAHGETPTDAKPPHPPIFTKAPTCVIGPYDDIPYSSAISKQIDWEAELAVIIGRKGKNISREQAFDHVFGYMVLNDVTARDLQRMYGGQFFKGKSLDGSCPTGPWIVSADEIGDAGDLEIVARVNGIEKQRDSTASMIIDVPGIIQTLSFGMTLEPGDIIATGTPAGVGFARTPPEYLNPGDVVECEISKIGTIRNRVTGE